MVLSDTQKTWSPAIFWLFTLCDGKSPFQTGQSSINGPISYVKLPVGKSDQGFDQSLENANLPSGVLAFTFFENRVVNRLKTGGLLGYF